MKVPLGHSTSFLYIDFFGRRGRACAYPSACANLEWTTRGGGSGVFRQLLGVRGPVEDQLNGPHHCYGIGTVAFVCSLK